MIVYVDQKSSQLSPKLSDLVLCNECHQFLIPPPLKDGNVIYGCSPAVCVAICKFDSLPFFIGFSIQLRCHVLR